MRNSEVGTQNSEVGTQNSEEGGKVVEFGGVLRMAEFRIQESEFGRRGKVIMFGKVLMIAEIGNRNSEEDGSVSNWRSIADGGIRKSEFSIQKKRTSLLLHGRSLVRIDANNSVFLLQSSNY